MTQKSFLSSVYHIETADQTREFYDAWSDSYDAEVGGNGYSTPKRCAEALTAVGIPKDARILDFGCGTGISGEAFHAAGFTNLYGCDLSAEMLAKATTKGVYVDTYTVDADDPLPTGFDVIAAVGVIGSGAAPPSSFDSVVAALPPGKHMVFSYNDKTLADHLFTEKLEEHLNGGLIKLFDAYGDHLPGIGMKSSVYVLKT